MVVKIFAIQHLKPKPVQELITFATSKNLESLKELDFEDTQIIDTETGEIISPFGVRSEQYGTAYIRRK